MAEEMVMGNDASFAAILKKRVIEGKTLRDALAFAIRDGGASLPDDDKACIEAITQALAEGERARTEVSRYWRDMDELRRRGRVLGIEE